MGAPVRVAKTLSAPGVVQAAFSGEGITRAEQLVKDPAEGKRYDIESLFAPQALASRPPSFKGLECRWQPLHSRNGMDLSLIVVARAGDEAARGALYRRLLGEIAGLCGKPETWRPVAETQLHLSLGPNTLAGEAKVRTSGQGRFARVKYLAHILFVNVIGKLLIVTGRKAGSFDGGAYRKATAQNTDYIKFDNVLRLVMDVSAEQQAALEQHLSRLHTEGLIFYGIHAAAAALMTCLVFDYGSDHFHFVDGADGGYALAAKAMKQQIKDAASSAKAA
jgi:hypothetical protein